MTWRRLAATEAVASRPRSGFIPSSGSPGCPPPAARPANRQLGPQRDWLKVTATSGTARPRRTGPGPAAGDHTSGHRGGILRTGSPRIDRVRCPLSIPRNATQPQFLAQTAVALAGVTRVEKTRPRHRSGAGREVTLAQDRLASPARSPVPLHSDSARSLPVSAAAVQVGPAPGWGANVAVDPVPASAR